MSGISPAEAPPSLSDPAPAQANDAGGATSVEASNPDTPSPDAANPGAGAPPSAPPAPAVSVLHPISPPDEKTETSSVVAAETESGSGAASSLQNSPPHDSPPPAQGLATSVGSGERTIPLQGGLFIRIDNSLDNVVVRVTTDYDVRFENYHQQIADSVAVSVVQSAISTRMILGGFSN